MNEQKINLLTGTKGTHYSEILNRLRILRIIAIGALFLVATSSTMLFLMIAFSPLPRLKEEESRLTKTVKSGEYQIKMDKYFIISSRLKDINLLLSQRPDVVSTYEMVENTLTGSVSVNFLDISDKSVALNLQSSSLGDIEQVVSNLETLSISEQPFKSLILSGVSYNIENNSYEMIVTMAL